MTLAEFEAEPLQLVTPPSNLSLELPRRIWHLATNQLNLMYILAAGLITGPKGFGRKYYADALAVAPGWVPLFPDQIPARALEQAVAEGDHLRSLAVAVDLGSLRGPVHALDAQGRIRTLSFPEGLAGDERVLLVPAPLPVSWIRAIVFASKEARATTRDEASDYANVPLSAYKQQIMAKLLKGVSAQHWPPADGFLPNRDAPSHQASAVGALMALLFGLGNTGDALVDAGGLVENAHELAPEDTAAPLLRALHRWVTSAPEDDADEVQTRMLLRLLNAIVDANARADRVNDEEDCPLDPRQVVLDVLESQKSHLAEPKWQEALSRLAGDLRDITGMGGDTVSEVLKRHPRSFSRGLILFFLREGCDELLDFEQSLLTDQDRVVAAALFAARSGWMSIPAELRGVNGLGEAITHRMAAQEQRARCSGVDLGPAPPRPRPLRELLAAPGGTWSKGQREGALALARGMRWQQLLQTRISLGKGDYRLQVDGRGAHLMLPGDVKAVTTEVDRNGLFALLAESKVPERVDTAVRAALKT